MATAETCKLLHLSQFEHVWHSSHRAGVGTRLAVAFTQQFGLDALGKLGNQAASHSLLDALPRPAATQTTAHTSPHLHLQRTRISACEAGSPFSSISSEKTNITLGESCNEPVDTPNTPEVPALVVRYLVIIATPCPVILIGSP